MDGNYKKCLKCGHQRTAADQGPEWGCPACGAVYAKVEAALAAKQALDAEEADARLAGEAQRLERAARGGGRGRVAAGDLDPDDRKGLAQLGYLLLAMPIIVSLLAALFEGGRRGAAGWPMLALIAGVVLAHVVIDKNDETWVDTHFRWQISTFWRMVGWSVGAAILLFIMSAVFAVGAVRGHGAATSLAAFGGLAIVFGLAFFVIGLLYFIRIVRGWISLNRGNEIGV
jgi:uncharacterized membrane protein